MEPSNRNHPKNEFFTADWKYFSTWAPLWWVPETRISGNCTATNIYLVIFFFEKDWFFPIPIRHWRKTDRFLLDNSIVVGIFLLFTIVGSQPKIIAYNFRMKQKKERQNLSCYLEVSHKWVFFSQLRNREKKDILWLEYECYVSAALASLRSISRRNLDGQCCRCCTSCCCWRGTGVVIWWRPLVFGVNFCC